MSGSKRLIISMSLLLAGTALGAGILGLPMETGLSGFLPSLIIMIITWITLMLTGWVFIFKISMSRKPVEDFADLYKREFGHWSIFLNTFGYFITFYGIITAYLCGISTATIEIFPLLKSIPYVDKFLIVIYFFVLTSIVIFGIKIFKKFNMIFSSFLLVTFIAMVLAALLHINVDYLKHVNLSYLPFATPILFTSFCFHPVIPLICQHVKEENFSRRILKWILFWGTFIILCVILFWSLVVLGIVPVHSVSGTSIIKAHAKGLPATVPLAKCIHFAPLRILALLFTFFAIVTSFIGSGAGFMNYVKNFSGHYIKRNKTTDFVITFAIPFLVALIYPNIFLRMLGVVGGIGVVTIYGILPSLLAIKPNNNKKIKIIGYSTLCLSLIVFFIELYKTCF
ncbi:MAG: hypothetical protein K9M56_05710 [Victivallales bacterium]|nr:hypothetical protein [Victivallales bacterium]